MKILIIGSGGREHALAATYAKSKRIAKIFVLPGNDFMMENESKISTVPHINIHDTNKIVAYCKNNKIDFVDVAPDDALADGLVDKLAEQGIPAFGPTQKQAEIEWNKAWSRDFMKKYKLPIPDFQIFSHEKKAIAYVKGQMEKTLYIKASGLAAGKGAIRAETKEEAIGAISAMKKFAQAGETFLIEEAMNGEEFSLFIICDGNNYIVTQAAQDHKTLYNADLGPNTGGMGSVSPVSLITKSLMAEIRKKIINPLMLGMKHEGRPYSGILYIGGMLTPKGVKIIEFNARWGDPEAQVILSGLKTDYVSLIESVMMQGLITAPVLFDDKIRISIAGCAKGYPDDYAKVNGKKIYGLKQAMQMKGITVFGAGIKKVKNNFVVNGGRVFHLVAEGKNMQEARQKAYSAMSLIFIEGNNLQYRTDIGWRETSRNIS